MKTFRVEPGHDALHRGVWHGPGVRVILEEGERLDVYSTTSQGARNGCIGSYHYAQLNPAAPPPGLRPGDG
ncbi:hypothetical protein [Vineibacter terrae]|uniref:hypothetical protein n=1 Tax=Vineibacter terrae TaxID=2586908 RepID=UPI002E36149B|nr:hypothetical protein [Vineibacter terrae]HEX2884864.1 hypothetical protein [Vineibacter terrae]